MSDWTDRIAGSLLATRLDSQALVDLYKFDPDGRVSFDATLAPPGAAGSFKISVPSDGGTEQASAAIPFGQSFGAGSVFWVSYRVYAPPEFCYQEWPTNDGQPSGHKLSITSHGPATNWPWEVVVQCTHNRNTVQMYHQDGSSFPPFEDAAATACSGSDFKQQPKVDNGAGQLSGTDPETGAAWTACQQDRARYGSLYSAQTAATGDFAMGLGDPIDGGFRQVPNEWLTITVRVQVGNFGSANSRVTGWCARPDQPYVKIVDTLNTVLGASGPFDYHHLLGYCTRRIAGGRKISARTGNITGVTLYTCGLDTPLGDGVLEYNATTQRFRYHGAGEAFGTARGFSSANGKLLLNLLSASNGNIVAEVNPAALPGSGTTTDDVTIADGRPDTHLNYADFILSTKPINAPGGFAVTALGQAALDLAAGAWAQFVVPNQDAILADDGSSGSCITFANSFPWNPISQCVEMLTSDHHGETPNMRHIRYNDLDDAFANVQGMGAVPGIGHGYDHNALNPTTGDFYHRLYGGDINIYRKALGAGSFSSLTSLSASAQVAIGACWWRGSFTGGGAQGSLVVFNSGNSNNAANDGQIVAYNPLTGTWFYNQVGKAPFYGSGSTYHSVIEYSFVKNVAVYGGGNVAPDRLWRISSDGSSVAMPNTPSGKIVGIERGVLVDDPVSGNFLLLSAGQLWELNPDGSGTWTQKTSPPGAVGVPGAQWVVAAAIPDYDVIMFITQENQTGGNVYLYKPDSAASPPAPPAYLPIRLSQDTIGLAAVGGLIASSQKIDKREFLRRLSVAGLL